VGRGVAEGVGVAVAEGVNEADGVGVGVEDGVVVGVGVCVGVRVSVFVGVAVTVGVGVGVGLSAMVVVGDGVEVGVGHGVTARAAITGMSSGAYHRITRRVPAMKAIRDPMAIRGMRRRHPRVGWRLSDRCEAGRDDAEEANRDRAHSRAASACWFSGSMPTACSAYARLERGSSLSHVSQSNAGRLSGSLFRRLQNARRASALRPSRAAASPFRRSAAVRCSIGARSMRVS